MNVLIEGIFQGSKSLHKWGSASSKTMLGDLTSGHAFDNGCTCFERSDGVYKDIIGKKMECYCGVSALHLLVAIESERDGASLILTKDSFAVTFSSPA